jgi:hypothetical protein
MRIRSASIIATSVIAFVVVIAGVFLASSHVARATQSDDTNIRINGHTPGVTPFISNVHLTASDTSVLKGIQFVITPKPGGVARPVSGTYGNDYLVNRGFENQQTGEITLPVY